MGHLRLVSLCFGFGLILSCGVSKVHCRPSIRDQIVANLTEVVHFIVGPYAKPNEDLINLAFVIRGSPKTREERTQYVNILKQIARKTPEVTKDFMTSVSLYDGTTVRVMDYDALDAHVIRRAMLYTQKKREERNAAKRQSEINTQTTSGSAAVSSTKTATPSVDVNLTTSKPIVLSAGTARILTSSYKPVTVSTMVPDVPNKASQQRSLPTFVSGVGGSSMIQTSVAGPVTSKDNFHTSSTSQEPTAKTPAGAEINLQSALLSPGPTSVLSGRSINNFDIAPCSFGDTPVPSMGSINNFDIASSLLKPTQPTLDGSINNFDSLSSAVVASTATPIRWMGYGNMLPSGATNQLLPLSQLGQQSATGFGSVEGNLLSQLINSQTDQISNGMTTNTMSLF